MEHMHFVRHDAMMLGDLLTTLQAQWQRSKRLLDGADREDVEIDDAQRKIALEVSTYRHTTKKSRRERGLSAPTTGYVAAHAGGNEDVPAGDQDGTVDDHKTETSRVGANVHAKRWAASKRPTRRAASRRPTQRAASRGPTRRRRGEPDEADAAGRKEDEIAEATSPRLGNAAGECDPPGDNGAGDSDIAEGSNQQSVDEYEDSDCEDLWEPGEVSEAEENNVDGKLDGKRKKWKRRRRNAKLRRWGISLSERYEDDPYGDNDLLELLLRKKTFIPKKNFIALVKQQSRYYNRELNWDKEALDALQGMAELELTVFFQKISHATQHAKRKTTNEKDVDLYKTLTGMDVTDSKESRSASRWVARECRKNEDKLDRIDAGRHVGEEATCNHGEAGDSDTDHDSFDGNKENEDEEEEEASSDGVSDWTSMDSDDPSVTSSDEEQDEE